jgi:ribonuclease HII
MIAIQSAVHNLNIVPDYVLVDGNRTPTFASEQGSIDSQAVVKGDDRVSEISAASIIAKVARDNEMIALDKLHPEYGFAKHKGYPTKLHLEKIIEYGVLDCYRQSFKPVARVLGIKK